MTLRPEKLLGLLGNPVHGGIGNHLELALRASRGAAAHAVSPPQLEAQVQSAGEWSESGWYDAAGNWVEGDGSGYWDATTGAFVETAYEGEEDGYWDENTGEWVINSHHLQDGRK